MTQLRDLAESKRDHFMFDPRRIKIDHDYNIRDLTAPAAREGLETLKLSLRESGMRVPLLIRMDGDEPTLVQGHRRLTAVMELIAEGVPWATVECLAEERKRSPEDRTIDLFLSNDGEPLTELEKAEGVRRLQSYGWDIGRIALKLGRSSAYISTLLGYERMPEQVKGMVREGVVSAAAAQQTIRTEGEANGTAILQEARADAERETPPRFDIAAQVKTLGADSLLPPEKVSRGVRVTPKRIAATKEKRDPKPKKVGVTLPAPVTEKVCAFLAKIIRGEYEECGDDLHNDADKLMGTIAEVAAK